MSSWTKPTAAQIDRAVALLVRPEYARTFFERLENPEWIEPLRAHGFFDSPPPVQFEDEGRTIVLTKWPASRYLARVAAQKDLSYAEPLQRALLAIPEATDNDTVHEDLITAAAALPGAIAAPIAERQSRWIKTKKWLYALIPQKLPALILTLLTDGQTDTALGLLKAALAFRQDTERGELVGKMDAYEYERLIEDLTPALADTVPLESVKAFNILLNAALNRLRGRDTAPDDYSHIWRESIGNDSGGDSLENSLASGLIEVARRAADRDPSLLLPIINELRRHAWSLFRRIELFLLAQCSYVSLEFAVAALTDRGVFDDHSVRREYNDLLRRNFERLDTAAREQIFGFINDGPDIEGYIAFVSRWSGRQPTDPELEEHVRHWKCDRLRPIVEQVRDRYGELVVGLEDIDANDEIEKLLRARTTSPVGAQELDALPIADLVAFLQSWRPPEGAITALIELGHELQSTACAQAARFINEIECFKAVHPTFVRSVIEGLAEAVKAGGSADWRAVLSFCLWIVEQPRLSNQGISDEFSDPGFSWSRAAVLRLLQAGFASETSGLTPHMHTEIWAVLQPITLDPDPLAADGLPENYDPSAHALNTIRGEALRTVISYGLWRQRQIRQNLEGTPQGAEILAVLDEHLTPGEALGILALYGEHFPQLLYLFPNWSTEHIDGIFPTDAGAERTWDATWPAYVVFCPAYSDVAALLRAKYLYAASHLEKPYNDWATLRPAEKLFEHVISLYLRSEIALDDGLITSMCAHSTAEQRSRMIWFTASSLQDLDCDRSRETVARSERLWEALIAGRILRIGRGELRSFGWFALSDCVPPVWFLEQLISVLEMGDGVSCEHGVIRRLAAIAQEHTAAVVNATMLFVRASTREFGVEAWRKEIGIILNAATCGDSTTRALAIAIIDYLGQQGVQIEGYLTLIDRLR